MEHVGRIPVTGYRFFFSGRTVVNRLILSVMPLSNPFPFVLLIPAPSPVFFPEGGEIPVLSHHTARSSDTIL